MREYPEDFRRQILDALRAAPYSVSGVAAAYGVYHSTVTRWARRARLALPDSAERAAAGAVEGALRRWGDFERRRRRAQQLRATGATVKQIAERLHYRSFAAVH